MRQEGGISLSDTIFDFDFDLCTTKENMDIINKKFKFKI